MLPDAIMTEISSNNPDLNLQPDEEKINAEDLLFKLRRKEGSWVDWGHSCAKLQKAGYNPQAIFEATGFEPIQQNQVIVGAQVYQTMLDAGVSEEVKSHFWRKGSDILYELRILTQKERSVSAEFILARNLDIDGAKEVAKAVKEFSRRSSPPGGFSDHPGDAVAYQYWRRAQQQSDIQERSRWIGRGLMFAHSQSARQKIEQLLMEIGQPSQQKAPNLPFYRLEAEDELPRIIPVAGNLPLTVADFKQIPIVEQTGPFQLVKYSGSQAWITLPGWQVVVRAEDPVIVLCKNNDLPLQDSNLSEDRLVFIDRAQREWNVNSYFVIEQAGQLKFEWFAQEPELPILGQVVLVLRPKKIVDEGMTKELWHIDE